MKNYFTAALLLGFLFPVTAKADLLVELQDASISAGGNVSVDVLISGIVDALDDPFVQMDEVLAEFELLLNINPAGVTAGTELQFIDPQSESFLTNSDYVFFGNSDAVINDVAASNLRSLVGTNDSLQVIDFNIDEFDDPIDTTVTSDNLLISFELTHQLNGANAGLTAGDTFEISVDQTSGFFDEGGFEIDFANNFATITVASAVPEPSTMVAGVVALLMLVPVINRRRRLAKQTCPA